MYADLIREAAAIHIRSDQSDTSAQDLQAVFGKVAEAVETFEGVSRGAVIHHGAGAPDNGLGLDIDAYIDTTSTDLYLKEAGAWLFRLTLRGAPSTVQGPRGPIGPASTVAGPTGKSAYELAVAAGYVGTLAQYLESLKGAPGAAGTDGEHGSRIRFESFAPGAEDGRPADLWIYTISAAKYSIYECYLNNALPAWRLRFTSPDATASTAPTTGGSTNGVTLSSSGDGTKFLNDKGLYVTVTAASSGGGTVKSVNSVSPDAAGNVSLTIGTGTVKSVNGLAPDAAGNVTVSTGTGSGTPLPAQDSNTENKFLKSNGSSASWAAVQEFLLFTSRAALYAYPSISRRAGQPARVTADNTAEYNGDYTILADGFTWQKNGSDGGFTALNEQTTVIAGRYYEYTLGTPRIWKAKVSQNTAANVLPVEADATGEGGQFWVEISRSTASAPSTGTGGYTAPPADSIAENQLTPALRAKINVARPSTTTIRFTQDAVYAPILGGTFALDNAGALVGTVVIAYLGPSTTAPTIPAGYQLLSGSYVAGRDLMYSFLVGGNGKIQYTINIL